MTYSIEVIISQPMSLQFSHYHMIKMVTKNSFYHLFYLLCAIQLPFQQRVLHLRSCMRGTHCDSKVLKSAISRQAKSNKFSLVFWLNEIVPLRRNRYNSYTIYLDVNRASRLGLLLCLTDETKDLHQLLPFLPYFEIDLFLLWQWYETTATINIRYYSNHSYPLTFHS